MFKVLYTISIVIIRHYLWKFINTSHLWETSHASCKDENLRRLKKNIFYLNLKYKFKKTSCITHAHFDVLRMLIAAWLMLGLTSKSGRLVSALRRLKASWPSYLLNKNDRKDLRWHISKLPTIKRDKVKFTILPFIKTEKMIWFDPIFASLKR